ncbi:MAG TPA: cupredoxin domain-containing protein [Gaiellaceae bacterium]|nr:cupredoxin domain-containing protein [Gaiellaceae bacterium]
MKRIVSLAAVFAVAAATVFAVFAYAGTSAKTTIVKVTAKDNFRFTLSRTSAPHGKVSFAVTNKGRLKHDFAIAGKKTKMLGHNQTATLTVSLSQGKHSYKCTVPGHAAAGMKGTFKAT